jgi:hypothetical protein
MSHEKRIVLCAGPEDAHAFDGVPVLVRTGQLDRRCPQCHGHGQWNCEIDLASQRSKRCLCPKCDGRGWIETGDDLVPSHDTALSDEGYPMWITRLDPSDDRDDGRDDDRE